MIIRKLRAKATMNPPMSEFAIMGLELGIIGHPMATVVGAGGNINEKPNLAGEAE